MKAIPVFDIKLEHGEGPVWCPESKTFYCVDLLKGTYHKVDFLSGQEEVYDMGQELGVMAIIEDGLSAVAIRDGFGIFNEAVSSLGILEGSPERENKLTRMNDGAVDPRGRFLAATMTYDGSEPIGNLYSLGQGAEFKKLEDGLYLPNGMGWSPDGHKFFLIDTNQNVMFSYNYDFSTGTLSNRKNHIQWSKDEFPDGMAIDQDGGFWVAMWMGSKVSHFDKDGVWVEDIEVPVVHTTSCCFGGPDMKTLFITTSQLVLSQEEKQNNKLAGRIFTCLTSSVGQIQRRFKPEN